MKNCSVLNNQSANKVAIDGMWTVSKENIREISLCLRQYLRGLKVNSHGGIRSC